MENDLHSPTYRQTHTPHALAIFTQIICDLQIRGKMSSVGMHLKSFMRRNILASFVRGCDSTARDWKQNCFSFVGGLKTGAG